MKKIGLLDANNFFVSCERLFRPDLVAKPVAVLSSNDGVIVARSNEIKAMGVPMGIPLFQAKQLVDMSGVTLFSSNFTLYRDISARLMQVMAAEVGECEVYSVDEAFFQVPDNITEAELLELRMHIMQKVGIPVSIGVSTTKTLAKVASEVEKKGCGYCLLTEEKWQELAAVYRCGEVWNIGRATARTLSEVGVKVASDFMKLDSAYVQSQFGVGGRRVQDELCGIPVHTLHANSFDLQKSIMHTRSFATTTTKQAEVESALIYHVSEAAEKLRTKGLLATRLYVLARASRHSDFFLRPGSREVELSRPTNTTNVLIKETLRAFAAIYDSDIPYKKAGVTLSGLVPESVGQLELFSDENESAEIALDHVVDVLNRRFGKGTIQSAAVRSDGSKASSTLRSPAYTTAWKDIPKVLANP